MDLEVLLGDVQAADRTTRIELRDAVAAHGTAAVGPMAEWLGHPEYSRFAVRVLERIASQEGAHEAALEALRIGREDAATDEVARDIDETLARLGVRPRRAGRRDGSAADAIVGRPGQPGRRYWAMRTSQWHPGFIWQELQAGRLRQGWGWAPAQDLQRIAARREIGGELTEEEQLAWRARRMLSTEPDGMRSGDLVVTQNLPRPGRLSVCQVVGSYTFDLPASPVDYGHVLPAELVVTDIGRFDGQVSVALRHAISLRPRLYEITPYGGDVEALLGGG